MGEVIIEYEGLVLARVDEQVEDLVLKGRGITSITRIKGIGRLVNLKSLDLSSNEIQLVALKKLRLRSNQIQRIEGLDNLTELDLLDLGSNQIKKIEGLDHLVNLFSLNLAANQIQREEGLEHLAKLGDLGLNSNPVRARWEQSVRELEEKKLRAETGEEKKDDRVSNWFIVDFWLLPQIIASVLFILLGFIYVPRVGSSMFHVTMFWIALLIVGNVGNALAIHFCTLTCGNVYGEGADYLGAFRGTIIPNVFVYAGELVWFLIVSPGLFEAVLVLILIQFLTTYFTSLLFSTRLLTLDLARRRRKQDRRDRPPRPTECPGCHVPLESESKSRCKQCGKAWCYNCGIWNEADLERCKNCNCLLPRD
jgi:hypothetical protein